MSDETSFKELANTCERLESLSSRISMINLVAEFLQKLEDDDVEPAVRMMIGKPLPSWDTRTLDVGFTTIINIVKEITGASDKQFIEAFNKTGDIGSTIKILLDNMPIRKQQVLFEKPLTIREVNKTFETIAETTGPGSRLKKERLVESFLGRTTPIEAKYIVKNFGGEMRHGFREGLMEEAIATAYNVRKELVRRANMLVSDLGLVAKIAKTEGEAGLEELGITLFHPVKPMLAEAVEGVEEALSEHEGRTSFEYKLDGARVQIHKKGEGVRIFSRRLSDVTESLPDVSELIRNELRADEAVVEGEVISVGPEGRPRPFQYLMRRFRRVRKVEEKVSEVPITLELFDVLYINGQPLIDVPYVERRKRLSEIVGKIGLTKQVVTVNPLEAKALFEEALSEGCEGLVAKQLYSNYSPGVRGKKWLKIKRFFDTLDLVIVVAEYGYGYRHAWLSDYHLAARNDETCELEVVGKCFTGLTDEEIQQMTKRLKGLKVSEEGRTVIVQPKIVLEIAFSEIQKSPHYKSGFALRFARILRIRDDKKPDDVDTINRIRKIYEKQFRSKAR